jgi:DNA-binding transcriptional regulator YbjK
LTAANFRQAAAHARISEQNRANARRVLVEGERVIVVAEDAGVSRQRIYQIVEQVLAQL